MDTLCYPYAMDMAYVAGLRIKKEETEVEENTDFDFHMNGVYIKEENEIDIKQEEIDDPFFEHGSDERMNGNSPEKDLTRIPIEKEHSKHRSYTCDECCRVFATKGHLAGHMRVHTKEKPFECNMCDMKFSWRGNLVKHKRMHTKEKPLPCKLCEKSFTWHSSLHAHMQTHNKNTYTCEICGQDIKGKNNLLKHKRTTHDKEKPHKCQICNMSFSWKFKLTSHLRTHTQEKPYGCDVCAKSFPIKAALVRHSITHTKEKPFTCDVCSKGFSQLDHLKTHKKRVHAKERTFVTG